MSAEPKMIPVARPLVGEAECEAASRVIRSGWLTQGPEVAAFEREFAAFVGAPHACAVSNCTTALHLALLAAGVGPGDEVVTVSHSFVATANAVHHCGATPVFVDIEPATFNLDPALLDAAITPRTKAILCVHQVGLPCDLGRIVAIAAARGVPLIEDAACAVGSEILWDGRWERIGRPHGAAACFSFHPRKLLTTGDGGMIVTRDPEWDRKFRLWRQHGMSVPDAVRHGAKQVVFEDYVVPGFNYRLTDLQAAVGREQLKRLPGMVSRRREQAERYGALLADVRGIQTPREPAWARANWQSYIVRLVGGAQRQRAVMQALLDLAISTRRGVMCSHREPAYRLAAWRAAGALAESERAQDEGVILPLYDEMTAADQERVAAALRAAWTV
jgi:dTDP-4-amino-4,6-dideoxygalactose transaminase